MVAAGKATMPEIALACAVPLRTLTRWKSTVGFQERVAEIVEKVAAELVRRGIAEKQNRLDSYVDLHKRMERVIAERAAAPPMSISSSTRAADVPGWSTGLLVHDVKLSKEMAYDVYSVDTGLLSSMNATKKQIAQEIGEWSEKHELSGKGGGPVLVQTTEAPLGI